VIDLLSDTVTLPSAEMLAAIGTAALGDDVYGEDPTVNALERLAAERLGKEAAALMPSGTMANLAALMSHCPRGTAALVGNESDLYLYEAGGASVAGSVVILPVRTEPDGRLLVENLQAALTDGEDDQCAPVRLVCLENTHNRCGGAVLPLSYLAEVRAFASAQKLAVHLDGARIFNAACALGVPPASIATHADSVQFCLSKGLAAPVGSMLVGTAPFIRQAKRTRKMLGGGMRQAGIIAAPGIVALERMTERLAEDHNNAKRLATGLARIPGIAIDPAAVVTNIVMFQLADKRFTTQNFLSHLLKCGVRMGELGRIRAVTHFGISAAHIDECIAAVEKVMQTGP
jgi:threonine aldolase